MSRFDNTIASDLFHVDPNTGKAKLNLHPGQVRMWDSDKRFVVVLAGTQSGKLRLAPGGCIERYSGVGQAII